MNLPRLQVVAAGIDLVEDSGCARVAAGGRSNIRNGRTNGCADRGAATSIAPSYCKLSRRNQPPDPLRRAPQPRHPRGQQRAHRRWVSLFYDSMLAKSDGIPGGRCAARRLITPSSTPSVRGVIGFFETVFRHFAQVLSTNYIANAFPQVILQARRCVRTRSATAITRAPNGSHRRGELAGAWRFTHRQPRSHVSADAAATSQMMTDYGRGCALVRAAIRRTRRKNRRKKAQ